MQRTKMIDAVLRELEETRQPSVSIKRILEKRKIGYSQEHIEEVNEVLRSKSLVVQKGTDSSGNPTYALSETGKDFLRSFGSYSNYLKGLDTESKRVERARKKTSYRAFKPGDEAATPYNPSERSFWEKNQLSLVILGVIILSFYLVIRFT
jgi:hypothetical protein